MNWLSMIGGELLTLGEATEPGIVLPVEAALAGLLGAIKAIAHPNTVAYKIADQGLSVFQAHLAQKPAQ